MEVMYDYCNNAHNIFLYSSNNNNNTTAPLDQAYYPTTNNIEELIFKATHQTPTLVPLPAPTNPYADQVSFPGSMWMNLSNPEDIDHMNYSSTTTAQSNPAETSREAKVLRYREKKKRRNFLKKIRYPSRKASAEIRPRVRGRFAKVTE